MKKKISAIFICAALAVACVCVFAGCSPSDAATIYDTIAAGYRNSESGVQMTGRQISDLDGVEYVTLHGSMVQGEDVESGVSTFIAWSYDKGVFYEGGLPLTDIYYSYTALDGLWYAYTIGTGGDYEIELYTPSGQFARYQADALPVGISSERVDLGNGKIVQIDAKNGSAAYVSDEPVLDEDVEKTQIGDVLVQPVAVDVLKIYDKDGEFLRMINLEKLVPVSRNTTLTPIGFVGDGILLQAQELLPSDASEYDYFYAGEKVAVSHYIYDMKSGDVSEKDLDYIFVNAYLSVDLTGDVETGVAIVSIQRITDNKTIGNTIIQAIDKDLKVAIDIQEIMPGANTCRILGDYLILGDGTITRVYDKEGNMVTEFADESRTLLSTGFFVKGTDYFELDGSLAVSLDAQDMLIASVYGKLYYAELVTDQLGGASTYQIKVYNSASGKTETLGTSEFVDFAPEIDIYYVLNENNELNIYQIGEDDMPLLSLDIAEIADVAFDLMPAQNGILVSYTVSVSDGGVISVENRYAFIDVQVTIG